MVAIVLTRRTQRYPCFADFAGVFDASTGEINQRQQALQELVYQLDIPNLIAKYFTVRR